MWRIEPTDPIAMVLFEATGGTVKTPDRGMVGRHAVYDEAILDTPRIDDAFLGQQGEFETQVHIRRRGEISRARSKSVVPGFTAGEWSLG
jgi:homogentisate 1,2-dioxygenase